MLLKVARQFLFQFLLKGFTRNQFNNAARTEMSFPTFTTTHEHSILVGIYYVPELLITNFTISSLYSE